MICKTLVTGFPRIGENRELKRALEHYWSKTASLQELRATAAELRKRHWLFQKRQNIDFISSNDFSYYDNMLDAIVMLNAVPDRFSGIEDETERYFAMARGTAGASAMTMSKWFDTNYHYIVPELSGTLDFRLCPGKILTEYAEAKKLGVKTKINVIGPITFMGLSRATKGENPFGYASRIIPLYKELLARCAKLDDTLYIQMEEPYLVKNPTAEVLALLKAAYQDLASVSSNIRIIVTSYFEHSNETTKILAETPIWGLGLDFVHGPQNIQGLKYAKGKKIFAGVVDGRNIWRNDLGASLFLLEKISDMVGREQVVVSTSCSLLHVPYSLQNEPESDIKQHLAFCCEKVEELALLGRVFQGEVVSDSDNIGMKTARSRTPSTQHDGPADIAFGERKVRAGDFAERNALQRRKFHLPKLPTTTIGSFPQTQELRRLRRDFKKRAISEEAYEQGIKTYIDDCIAFQEEIGLDVLVHGEPERNDMVEYFGEMLKGFHFTDNGWVQSYGSRCVKPPIIYGDISRTKPMTVRWISYAQRRSKKPVKGMLTGPVTILNWSFVREDIPRPLVARQIAAALCDEVADLQAAGISIIQVDEAAFREGYPLRKENVSAYERWAVDSFRLAVSSAAKETQIHTHMCYSDFTDIIKTIEAMDADVITIETARGGNRLLDVFEREGYHNEIGPGVYDIHSPRIPSEDEFEKQIFSRLEVLDGKRMWINPDCGLKTRRWEEVRPALQHMVSATRNVRLTLERNETSLT
jgi:5-methyltetrahydropteroyltriglutamate--homocysteine methyltransferase